MLALCIPAWVAAAPPTAAQIKQAMPGYVKVLPSQRSSAKFIRFIASANKGKLYDEVQLLANPTGRTYQVAIVGRAKSPYPNRIFVVSSLVSDQAPVWTKDKPHE